MADDMTDLEGHDSAEALKAIGRFVEEHAATVLNALGNHHRRMDEAADMAAGQGQTAYAKVFREDARSTWAVLTGLSERLEALSEGHTEDFADQG